MKKELVAHVEEVVRAVLHKYNAKRGGLFGSITSGDFTENSDVDVLVELPEGSGLLEFIQIKQELEDLLKRSVDLVEYASIKPFLQKIILQQEKRIYG